jgi:hypothetical protein
LFWILKRIQGEKNYFGYSRGFKDKCNYVAGTNITILQQVLPLVEEANNSATVQDPEIGSSFA